MRNIYIYTVLFLCLNGATYAQHRAGVKQETIYAKNFDLKAVATAFGLSVSLDDFERRLNLAELRLSNLDMNRDGKVDYIRVHEVRKSGVKQLILENVTDADNICDLATIIVDKGYLHQSVVQIVGNPAIYGSMNLTTPVYPQKPAIIAEMENIRRSCRISVWGTDKFPRYYKPSAVIPLKLYQSKMLRYRNDASRYNRQVSPVRFYSFRENNSPSENT